MKESEFPEKFDLFHISYANGCQAMAYAPMYTVNVGDRVVTTFDEGIAKAIVKYVTPDEEWFKMISNAYTIDRITHKIVEVR